MRSKAQNAVAVRSKAQTAVAVRSKAQTYSRSLAGIGVSNPAGGTDVCFFLNVVCCQVAVPATGPSPIQRLSTDCVCVNECDQIHSTLAISR